MAQTPSAQTPAARTPFSLPVRIGTRGSPLALAQAHQVRDMLMRAHGMPEDAFSIVVRTTSGDAIQDRPLSEVGGKGLFTKELEEGLLADDIDLAVHSMKDVATVLPDGLGLHAILAREDVRDAFLSPHAATLEALPQGAVVGTSSLRRQAQVLRARPDLSVVMFRGNVQTRLRKLDEGVADATLLACAGLKRMDMLHHATSIIETETMLPAVAQGAIGIETQNDNAAIIDLIQPLNDQVTALCVTAERAFLRVLDGSCRTPIAGLATLTDGRLSFRGEILSPDGRHAFADAREGPAAQAVSLAQASAHALLDQAGPDFLAAFAP
ncbi:MAG: hydroxymethylbilane synthase [Pseudomonadota bacterium]